MNAMVLQCPLDDVPSRYFVCLQGQVVVFFIGGKLFYMLMGFTYGPCFLTRLLALTRSIPDVHPKQTRSRPEGDPKELLWGPRYAVPCHDQENIKKPAFLD